jgi:hypothetical protein
MPTETLKGRLARDYATKLLRLYDAGERNPEVYQLFLRDLQRDLLQLMPGTDLSEKMTAFIVYPTTALCGALCTSNKDKSGVWWDNMDRPTRDMYLKRARLFARTGELPPLEAFDVYRKD